MNAITADRLTKRYGAFTAVDALSFDLEPGTVTGFVGVNEAGKSTTMRTLLGLSRPSSGRALIEGTPYAALSHPIRTCGALLDRHASETGARSRAARRPRHPGPRRAGQRAGSPGDPMAAPIPANSPRRGRTGPVSSHQLAELGQTLDDVLVIHRGRLVAGGALADLSSRASPGSLEEPFLHLVTEGDPP